MKRKLTTRLPEDERELADKGFGYNRSRGKEWVTDGHALFRSAPTGSPILDESIRYTEVMASVASDKIRELWETAEQMRRLHAAFVGCGRVKNGEEAQFVAFLRDTKMRVIACNAYKLAFVVRCTHPDSLAIPLVNPSERPITFFKRAVMIAMLMPLQYSPDDIAELPYDWKVESISLSELNV